VFAFDAMARPENRSAPDSLAPGSLALGEHMGQIDRALSRSDLDMAAQLLDKVPKADLSPFLRNEAASDNVEAVRFLLRRGAALRNRFSMTARATVAAGKHWSSCWKWEEIRGSGYDLSLGESSFNALDAAVCAGALDSAALICRAFPGCASVVSHYRPISFFARRPHPLHRRHGLYAPTAAFAFAHSERLERRPDLAQKMFDFLTRENLDFFASCGSAGTPLSLACFENHSNLALLLLSAPQYKSSSRPGFSPLMSCVLHDELTILEMLLAAGENPNASRPKEPTPLWIAIAQRSFAAAELLLKHGAKISVSVDGVSLAQHAQAMGFGLPTALLEESAITRSVQDGAESARKKQKKEFAKEKRELAEREGLSLEEAAERLRAEKAQVAARALSETGAPASPRRGRRL